MTEPAKSPRAWTFLSNHGHVLIFISKNPDARIRDISNAVGITDRSTQGILSDLQEAGYITVERVGRRNRYVVDPHLKFRHPEEEGKPISALLKIFT